MSPYLDMLNSQHRIKRLGLALCFAFGSLYNVSAQQLARTDIASIRRSDNGKQVLIATHRGGIWQRFPENSIESIQAAIALGVDFIEIDVRKTKDHQLILMHDQTLDRTTTGKGRVKDHTLAEINALFLKDKHKKETKYRPPTLRDALTAMKGKVFIKIDKYNEEKIFGEILKVLEETGTSKQASFRVGLNYSKFQKNYGMVQKTIHIFPALEGDTISGDFDKELQTFQSKLKPVVFQAKFKDSASAIVPILPAVNKAGYHIWTMSTRPYYCGGWDDQISLKNPDQGWGRLIANGVTIIETDYPEELHTYLKRKNLHP